MYNDQFATLALELIVSSLTNPRKTFNQVKLQELADSIKASGVHQPILVRPLPGHRLEETSHITRGGRPLARATHELVCGERRHRASMLAGVATIPAMVRNLTDDQVREIQIIENLQRDDLTELEEAEGYEQLMQHSGLTADQVAAKIGKSRSYVYARLKLLDLSLECKQALRDGKIDASRALLIARIPDTALQIKTLAYASTMQSYPAEVPSVRTLQDWLKKNVMLKLEHAVFKLTDTRLVEAAGSCTDCPKRTGANPDLFADVDGADICTDPACFHSKEEAYRAQLIKKAEARGLRVVQDKEALELLDGRSYLPIPYEYTNLADKCPDFTNEGDRPATMAQLLGADAPAPILFVHPHTQVITELVPTQDAQAVLLAKGLIKAEAHRATQSFDLDKQLAKLQETAQRETDAAVHKATHNAARNAIRAASQSEAQTLLTGEVLRAYLLSLTDELDEQDMARICNYEFADGVDELESITGHIQRMGDTDLLRTVALSMLDRDSYRGNSTPIQDAFTKLLLLDTKAITKTATAAIKAEYASRIKEMQKQIEAQKAPLPLAPAAPAQTTQGKAKKTPPAAPARKPKLSAADAQSGIAAAMQGMDRAGTSPPEAQQGEMGCSFAVGQHVRITTDDDKLGTVARKWAGKEGAITKTNVDYDPDLYDVTFKGRGGGIAMFRTDQIAVVGVPA